MRDPLWNGIRKELSQYPHHDPQMGILSLVPVVPGAQLIGSCNFHQLKEQRTGLGCPPERGQIKGEVSSPNTQFSLQVTESQVSKEFPFAHGLQFLDPNCWNPWLNPTLHQPMVLPPRGTENPSHGQCHVLQNLIYPKAFNTRSNKIQEEKMLPSRGSQ